MIKHTEVNLKSILSITYVKEMPRTLINDSVGVVKFCSLRGENRRGWEGRVKRME